MLSKMGAKKILVIDDEEDILELFTRVLKDYAVETAADEEQALAKTARSDFDLVFLDIVIPEVNGLELFKLVRKIRPKAKIVVMTGFAVEEDLNRAVKLGAAGVMRKPFAHINDIRRMADQILGENRNNQSGLKTKAAG